MRKAKHVPAPPTPSLEAPNEDCVAFIFKTKSRPTGVALSTAAATAVAVDVRFNSCRRELGHLCPGVYFALPIPKLLHELQVLLKAGRCCLVVPLPHG